MQVKKAFCLFEQSGTFKNEFRKFGVEAEDYDILNDFGETDHVVDLFEQINCAYNGEPSLFDEIGQDDIALAFFPCTRFEAKIQLGYRGELWQQKNQTEIQKLEYSLKLHEELASLYALCAKLFTASYRGGGGSLLKIRTQARIT